MTKMRRIFIVILLVFVPWLAGLSQGDFCVDSEPFCTSDSYVFPAGVNSGSAEWGPNYGCLATQPNPAWYHLKIGVAGDINIRMFSTPTEDIDFICWGPFTDPVTPCTGQLTGGAIVDCSYSGSSVENCYIPDGKVDEYYILLITNFSNDPCNISFEKTAGTGETDCSIIPPPMGSNSPLCVGDDLNLWADDVNNATYAWTGPNGFTSNQQNPTIANVGLQHAGDYELVVSVNGNQSSPVSTTVEIFPRPFPNFSYVNSCTDETVTFTDLSTVNPATEPITTWEWDFGDGQTSPIQNPSHLYATPGTYNVSLTTYTGAMGCPQTIVVSVDVYNTPSVNAGADQTIPNGWYTLLDGSIGGGSGQYSYSWSPAGMLVDPTVEDPQTIQLSADQVFTLQVTDLNSGCTSTDIVTVFVTGSPFTSSITATPMSVCSGEPVDLLANASGGSGTYTYSWYSAPAGFTSTISNPSHTPGFTTTYYVDVFDGQNTITSQVTVQVIPNPVADAGRNKFIPVGTSTILDGANVSGGSGVYTYSWTPAGLLVDPTVLNPQTVALSQNTSFVLTVTDANGCISNSDQMWVIPVFPPTCPTLTVDFTSTYVGCSEVVFEDNTTFDFPDPSYNIVDWYWDFGDGTTGSGNPVNHHFDRGIFTDVKMVILVDSMGFICTDSVNKLMMINQSPDVFIASTPNPVCVGEPVFYTGTSGFNIGNWLWDFGDGHASTLNSPNQTHVYNTPGTYDVTLTVIDENGCDSTISPPYQQIVLESPLADFSWDPHTGCLNSPIQFTDLSSATVIGWDWFFDDGFTSNLQNPIHVFNTAGNFDVTLTVTDTAGCSSSITKTIHINSLPEPDFITNTPICHGNDVQFTNLSVSPNGYIIQWIWDFGDGNSVVVDHPDDPDVAHPYAAAGTYQVSLTVIDSDSCEGNIVKQIDVAASPIADFIFDANCFGAPVLFTDLSTPNGGPDLYYWQWNFGDPNSGGNNVSSLQNPSHIFTSQGVYSVQLIVFNLEGCSDTIIQDITVDPSPQVDFSMTGDSICLEEEVNFSGIGSFSSWTWYISDGGIYNAQSFTHFFQSSGTFEILLIALTADGCVSIKDSTVVVNQLPAVDFEHSGQACINDAIDFLSLATSPNGQILQWTWDFGDGTQVTIDYPDNPNISHVYTSNGNYEVILTVTDQMGCENYKSRFIDVVISPIVNFNFESSCVTMPVLFTDASATGGGSELFTWEWYFDDPASGINNTSNLQNPSHIFTGPGTYSVSLVVTNILSCSDTSIIDIVMDSLPVIDITMTEDTLCLGEIAEFFGVGTDILTWEWDFGDGIGYAFNQNSDYLYSEPGVYTVTLTATDINDCQVSVFYDIEVRDLPAVDFTTNNLCTGDITYFFDDTQITNGYPVSWEWDFGDGTTSNLQNPAHLYNSFGNYQVVLTVTDNAGCENYLSRTISIYDHPEAAFSFQTVCDYEGMVNFSDESNLSNSNSPIESWHWNFGDGFTSSERNPQHIYAYIDSCYAVVLTIVDTNGCSATDTNLHVCVYQSLDVSFSSSDNCSGDPVFFQAFYTPGYDSIISYTWNFNDGSAPVVTFRDTLSHVFPEPGNYTVELSVVDTNGCAASVYENVVYNQLPSPDFTYSQGMCDSIQFSDQSVAGGSQIKSWYWDFGDYSSSENYAVEENPIHYYPPNDSVYNVKLIITNLNGCIDSIVKPITVYPCLHAEIEELTGMLCAKSEICFNDLSYIYSNNLTINNWHWDFGDGTTLDYNTAQNSTCHTYAAGGTYEVKLTISVVTQDNSTLSDEFAYVVNVNPAPTAQFYVSSTSCSESLTDFTDLSDDNGASISIWEWDFGDLLNPGGVSNIQNPSYFYSEDGLYTIEFIVANDVGCSDTIYQEIEIFKKPQAEFIADVACLDKQTFFYDESIDGGAAISAWNWNFGNPLSIIDTSYQENPVYTYSTTGTYNVNLIITDLNQCKDTVTNQIDVFENPIAGFEIDDNYENQQGQINFVNTSSDALTYYWDFGDGQSSEEENPTITYYEDGIYTITLIVANEDNCLDTISYPYEMMYTTLYVPNAFAPGDSDGIYTPAMAEDAAFIIKGVNLSQYQVAVYDAWGTVVWKSDALIDGQPAESWNGHYNGNANMELCPSGVYTWKVTAIFRDGTVWKGSNNGDNNTKPYGTVTLIR